MLWVGYLGQHRDNAVGWIPWSAQGQCCGLDTLVSTGTMLWVGYLGQHRDSAVGGIPWSAQGQCCGWDTLVSTGTMLWAGYLGQHRDNAVGWIKESQFNICQGRGLSLSHSIQTDAGAHPAACPVCAECSYSVSDTG